MPISEQNMWSKRLPREITNLCIVTDFTQQLNWNWGPDATGVTEPTCVKWALPLHETGDQLTKFRLLGCILFLLGFKNVFIKFIEVMMVNNTGFRCIIQ